MILVNFTREQADFAKSTCIEVTEKNKGFEIEIKRLTNELEQERNWFDSLSKRRNFQEIICRKCVQHSSMGKDKNRIKSAGKIFALSSISRNKTETSDPTSNLDISDTASLELSATGYLNDDSNGSFLHGATLVKSTSKQQNDDGVLNATIPANSTYGHSDFILDWMEGAGFVTGNQSHYDNDAITHTLDDDESLNAGESRSLLASPIPLLMSPGGESRSSLDMSGDLKIFARGCKSIRNQLCTQNSDVSILLQETTKFENLYTAERKGAEQLRQNLRLSELHAEKAMEDFKQRLKDSETKKFEIQESNIQIQYSFNKKEEELQNIKNELSEAEGRCLELSNQLSVEKTRASEKLKSLAEKDIIITKFENKLKRCEEENNVLTKTITALNNEISATKLKANEEVEICNRVSQQEVQYFQISTKSLEEKVLTLQHSLSSSNSTCKNFQDENQSLQEELKKSAIQQGILEVKLNEKTKSIEALESTTANITASLSDTEVILKKLNDDKLRLEDEVKSREVNQNNLKVKLSVLESEYFEIMKVKETRDDELKGILQELSEEKEKCQCMKQELNNVQVQVEMLTTTQQKATIVRDEALSKLNTKEKKDLSHRYKLERKNSQLRECVEQLNKKCHVSKTLSSTFLIIITE